MFTRRGILAVLLSIFMLLCYACLVIGDADDAPPWMSGPYSLCMVAQRYGVELDVEAVALLAETTKTGTIMECLADAACQLGIKAVSMKTNYDGLLELEPPFIALVKSSGDDSGSHYIVIDEMDPRQVKVWWPHSRGDSILQKKEFQKIWSGHALTLAAPEVQNKEDAPDIEIEEPVYDFGAVARMEEVQHTFVIRNVGQSPLEILKVTPACIATCTDKDARLGERSIPPGGRTTLDMVYRGRGVGKGRGEVRLVTNDPNEQLVILSIVGVTTGRVGVSPGHFYLGEMGQDESIRKSFDIHQAKFREGRIKSVKSSSPKVKVKLLEASNRELLARVDFQIEAGLPEGPFRERIIVITDDATHPEKQVSIEGIVVGDVLVRPDQFFMGFLNTGIPVQRTVMLEKRGEADLKILRVENSLPSVQVTWTAVEPGRKYQIDAICTPTDASARSIRDVVRVNTNLTLSH